MSEWSAAVSNWLALDGIYSWFAFEFSNILDLAELVLKIHLLSLVTSIRMGNLLYTIAVVLIIIWLLGFLGVLGAGIATSGLIHILLVIAVIAIIFRLIQGRSV